MYVVQSANNIEFSHLSITFSCIGQCSPRSNHAANGRGTTMNYGMQVADTTNRSSKRVKNAKLTDMRQYTHMKRNLDTVYKDQAHLEEELISRAVKQLRA